VFLHGGAHLLYDDGAHGQLPLRSARGAQPLPQAPGPLLLWGATRRWGSGVKGQGVEAGGWEVGPGLD